MTHWKLEPLLRDEVPAPSEPGPLEKMIRREQIDLLKKEISELPEQMRRCVEFRARQVLSYREIAVVMQLSVATVQAHLFQARRRLRTRLAEALGESGS